MKTRPAVALVLFAILGVSCGSSVQAEDAEPRAALTWIKASLADETPLEALCITAVLASPRKTFCYYLIGGSQKLRDDDKDPVRQFRSGSIEGVHETWMEKVGVVDELSASRAEIDELTKKFLDSHESFGVLFYDLAPGNLRKTYLDLREIPAGHRPEMSEIVLFAHWYVDALLSDRVILDDVSDPVPTASEVLASGERNALELAALKNKVKIFTRFKEIRKTGRGGPEYSSFLVTFAEQLNWLEIGALALLILGYSFLAAKETYQKWSSPRPLEHRDGREASPRGAGQAGPSLGPVNPRQEVENSLVALRRFAENVDNRKRRKIVEEHCNKIASACERISRDKTFEAVTFRVVKKLRGKLFLEGVSASNLEGLADEIIKRFSEIRSELREISGERDPDKTVRKLVESIENQISTLPTSSEIGLESLPRTLPELKDAWNTLAHRQRELEAGFEDLLGKDAVIDPEAIRGGVRRLQERLHRAKAVAEPFASLLGGEEYVVIARHAADTYRTVRERCLTRPERSSAEVPKTLSDVFDRLDEVAREHLSGQLSGHSPPQSINDLDARLGELKTRESELQRQIDELEKIGQQMVLIETFLGTASSSSESALNRIQRLEADRERGLKFLQSYGDGDSLGEIAQLVDQSIERTKSVIRGILPEAEGDVHEMAESLVDRYEDLQAAAKGCQELCQAFSHYLDFDWQDFGTSPEVRRYLEIVQMEMGSEHRPLRLGLAAALIGLERARTRLLETRHGDTVVSGLRIRSIESGLAELLRERLARVEREELWVRGLRPGFSLNWLHELFRAELILQSFYENGSDHRELADAVSMASAVLRFAMRGLGKGIEDVVLLETFPSEPPEGWARPRYLADEDLRSLSEVNRRVLEELRTRDNFIVDVERFRLTGDDEHPGECRVVVVSPAEWRQSQKEA